MIEVIGISGGSNWGVGWIADWLAEHGIHMRIVRPYLYDSLPAARSCAGVIVLPGSTPVSEIDRTPWMSEMRHLLHDCLDRERPILGICFGAQLLATCIGGEVHDCKPLYGITSITRTSAEQGSILDGIPLSFEAVCWHEQAVTTLPSSNATILAKHGQTIQAFATHTNAWGLQFHPEASEHSIRRWSAHYADKLWGDRISPGDLLDAYHRARNKTEHIGQHITSSFARAVHNGAQH